MIPAARHRSYAALIVLVPALTACAPTGWESNEPVTGYALCDETDASIVTLHYDSGLGVDAVEPRILESDNSVSVVVHLRGSGSVPAIGIFATIDVDLDRPIADRNVLTLDDQPVRQLDC